MARDRSELTLLSQGFALRKELIDSGPMDLHASVPLCVRFDNGSSRPEAARNLRGSGGSFLLDEADFERVAREARNIMQI